MNCIRFNTIGDGRGFTLIEVIISLIVAGILGAMVVSFMGTGMMKSANPVIHAQNGNYLNSIMEKMYADYKYQMFNAAFNGQTPENAFSNFESHVNTANYYSDASHPYTVAKKRIAFTGNPPSETEDTGSDILKVTIQYKGLSATQIFTE